MPFAFSVLAIIASLASLISFVGDLLFAPPQKRGTVKILAFAFVVITIITIGLFWLTTLQNQQITTSQESNRSLKIDVSLIQALVALPFPVKFAGITFTYVGILCLALWLLTQILSNSLSLRQAAVHIWGSHVARLRSMLLAGIICSVLAIV